MASSLPRRIAVAGVGIPAAFGLVFLGGWALVGALLVLGIAGASEFYRIAHRAGARPLTGVGYAGVVLAPTTAYALMWTGDEFPVIWAVWLAVAWFLTVMGVAVFTRRPDDGPVWVVTATVFGAVYAGVLPAFLLLLRHGHGLAPWAATWLVFYPLAMTWICDTFAMAGGSLIGGPKLAPGVSPNKTWAGALSGVGGAMLVAVVYGVGILGPIGIDIPAWQMVVLGVIVGGLGQIGDLAESLFKRSVGVKDSGTFFPGHGGVLDRLDSLYWVIPLAALFLYTFRVS